MLNRRNIEYALTQDLEMAQVIRIHLMQPWEPRNIMQGVDNTIAAYRASIQVFDPTSLTATSEKKRCSGSPLRVPR